MLAVLVYHHSGLSGCLCVWLLVLTSGAHWGGWIWSMLSFMCLASLSMYIDGGMLCGVGMLGFFLFAVMFWCFIHWCVL